MRCHAAPAVVRRALLSESERAALNAVRHLGSRFPVARIREAPLVRAAELDARADPSGATRVWLALEALQVTGSFKVRGALVSLDANRERGHVVAASAGNHGAGVAYAAAVLGLSATVCVPRTAPETKRARIQTYGAELLVTDSDAYEDAERLAREIATVRGLVFISPYDDVHVVRGNGSSLGFEIVRALGGVPERILAPFGGGGLATGLAWALAAEARGQAEPAVWGVQSAASCAMANLMDGEPTVHRLPEAAPAESRRDAGAQAARAPSLAEGLVGTVSPDAFERARSAIAGIVVVSEGQIAAAMAHAYRDMGLVVEGSAAAALAPVLFGLPEPVRGGDLVVVLTGRNVDQKRLDGVLGRAVEGI